MQDYLWKTVHFLLFLRCDRRDSLHCTLVLRIHNRIGLVLCLVKSGTFWQNHVAAVGTIFNFISRNFGGIRNLIFSWFIEKIWAISNKFCEILIFTHQVKSCSKIGGFLKVHNFPKKFACGNVICSRAKKNL